VPQVRAPVLTLIPQRSGFGALTWVTFTLETATDRLLLCLTACGDFTSLASRISLLSVVIAASRFSTTPRASICWLHVWRARAAVSTACVYGQPRFAPHNLSIVGRDVGTGREPGAPGTRQQAACPTTTATIMSRSYNFGAGSNDNGDVLAIVNCRDNNRSQNFTYDHLNRITQGYSTGPNWGETFTIDP
jgi:hypothetical protein